MVLIPEQLTMLSLSLKLSRTETRPGLRLVLRMNDWPRRAVLIFRRCRLDTDR